MKKDLARAAFFERSARAGSPPGSIMALPGVEGAMARRKASEAPIHIIGYASQPDIQFICDEAWDTPKWGSDDDVYTDTSGVYVSDTDRLYTFDRTKVTCPACLKACLGTTE